MRYVNPIPAPEWKKYAGKWKFVNRHFSIGRKIRWSGHPKVAQTAAAGRVECPAKKLVADLSLDKQMLQDVIKKLESLPTKRKWPVGWSAKVDVILYPLPTSAG